MGHQLLYSSTVVWLLFGVHRNRILICKTGLWNVQTIIIWFINGYYNQCQYLHFSNICEEKCTVYFIDDIIYQTLVHSKILARPCTAFPFKGALLWSARRQIGGEQLTVGFTSLKAQISELSPRPHALGFWHSVWLHALVSGCGICWQLEISKAKLSVRKHVVCLLQW